MKKKMCKVGWYNGVKTMCSLWEEFVENYNKGVTTLDDFIGDINEDG